METVRQDVEQEAAHKLGSIDAHDFPPVIATFPVLCPAEADVSLAVNAFAWLTVEDGPVIVNVRINGDVELPVSWEIAKALENTGE